MDKRCKRQVGDVVNVLVIVRARKRVRHVYRTPIREAQEPPLGSRESVKHRWIFLKEAFEGRREVRQRARVRMPQMVQSLRSRFAKRLPRTLREDVLGVADGSPRFEERRQFIG